jgi:hypothetical protein
MLSFMVLVNSQLLAYQTNKQTLSPTKNT